MIRRLYVHNFRCLENFELPIGGKPSTLLIGRNGSGKSTVGTVLELFQRIARGTNRVGQLVASSDFAQGRITLPMRFEIAVALGDDIYEYILALNLPHLYKELCVVEERLSVSGKVLYSRIDAKVQLLGSIDTDAKFMVDEHLIALPIIQENNKADPLYIFKTWLARMLIIAPIPSRISGDAQGETLTPDRDLENFGAWLSGVLAYSPASYSQIDTYLREVLPDFKVLKLPLIGKEFRSLAIHFQQDEAEISLPFCDLSDGEKCFFICAVVLAANASYGPLFCFWDEPDNFLSLSEVGHLVMTLRRSFQKSGQLLISSHNPEAVRSFSDENTLVLGRRSHLEPTIVRPLEELNIKGDIVDALIRNDVKV